MTYTYTSTPGSAPTGDFASALAVEPFTESRRHPSVVTAIQNRRPEVELVPDRVIADAYEQRLVRSLSHFQRMQKWNGRQLADAAEWLRPHLPLGALGQSSSDGAGQVDQLRQMLFAALKEMHSEIPKGELPTIGRHMLLAKSANVSAEVGFAVTPRDLAATALSDLLWFAQQEGTLEGMASDYNGRQIATSLKDQGEPISTFQKLSSSFGDVYGKINDWSQMNGLTSMASFAEGTGVRKILEGSIEASGTGKWLNEQTLGKVVGAARQVASAIQSGKPGAIVSSVGGIVAMVGLVVPQPAGIIVSAVGAVISLVGALIDWLMGEPPPPPKLIPCSVQKFDAWACLRIYLAAERSPWKMDDKTSIQDLKLEGWDVQVDIYTGEVLVMVPGTGIYRRILDVFERGILLHSYTTGKFTDWMMGKLQIVDTYVQPQGLRNTENPEGKGLWCYPQKNDTVARYIAADVSSSALRFRVHAKSEDGEPVDAWRGHGAKNITWSTIGDTRVAEEYRGAVLASAFLGGTMPYGRVVLIDGGGICTGVGGSYEGKPSDNSLKVKRPIMCRVDANAKDALRGKIGMYVIEPTVRPPGVKDDSGATFGSKDREAPYPIVKEDAARLTRYGGVHPHPRRHPKLPNTTQGSNYCPACLSWRDHGVPFHEFAQRVLDDGAWRASLRIPSNSPRAVDVPPVDLRASATKTIPSISTKRPATPPQVWKTIQRPAAKASTAKAAKTSTVAKVVVGVSAAAVAGTGGYLLYRKFKKGK